MKSIFFLSLMNGSAWGGSEELWYQTALWMGNNGYSVDVCCYDWEQKNNRLKKLEETGVKVFLLPNKKGLLKKYYVKTTLAKIPFEAYDLIFVNQGGWEEVTHGPFKNLYLRFKKYVLAYHNYNSDARLSATKQSVLKNWINNAVLNMGLTGKVFTVLKKNFNIDIEKKIVYANPITLLPPRQLTAYPAAINGNYIFVMLAELAIDRKAQDVLINVLANEKWKNRNWQLHLYGKGKDELLLQQLINKNNLQEKVFLKGFTLDVKSTLEQSHFLLQCTHIDAMPISVVEAMAIGRPCLVSNVGDMPLWIEDNYNGFVCADASLTEIDKALEYCWNQKDKWHTLGANAFETFIKKYPVPYEEKLAALLHSL